MGSTDGGFPGGRGRHPRAANIPGIEQPAGVEGGRRLLICVTARPSAEVRGSVSVFVSDILLPIWQVEGGGALNSRHAYLAHC